MRICACAYWENIPRAAETLFKLPQLQERKTPRLANGHDSSINDVFATNGEPGHRRLALAWLQWSGLEHEDDLRSFLIRK